MKKKYKKIIIIGAVLIGSFGLIWLGSILENENREKEAEIYKTDQLAIEQLSKEAEAKNGEADANITEQMFNNSSEVITNEEQQFALEQLRKQLSERDKKSETSDADQLTIDKTTMTNPIITLHTTKGNIDIELFMDTMPITAGNFLKLAKEGFYDDIKFHRVIDGFMIQGGDPNTKGDNTATYGSGGPGYAISDEFVEGPSNVRGTISMANSGPNTGGSQFFINLVDNTNLDFNKEPLSSKHPVFGNVVSDMNIVDAIGSVATGAGDIPIEPVIIQNITIEE